MANYKQCAWANFDLNFPPTNANIIRYGTLSHTIIGGSNSNYGEYYLLADGPVKLIWNTHGANQSLFMCSENNGVKIYRANVADNNDNVASVYETTVNKGTSEQVWIYAGIDGYYGTVSYDLAHSYDGSYPRVWMDIEGTDIPTYYHEDGRAKKLMEERCNDNNWNWSAVNTSSVNPSNNTFSVTVTATCETEPTPTPFSVIVTATCVEDTSDPNNKGGTSGTGGGTGIFDDSSDTIPLPTLPSVSSVDTGMVSLFRPTKSQLAALGEYLWTHITDFWENLQKLFSNPMDYFVAFNIFPVVPSVGTERAIHIGNWVSNVSMPPVLSQWYDFDCGEVTIPLYWGSALDYAPNTKIQLMLPFIGAVNIDTDEVMGQTLRLKYHIDLLSGSCVAMLSVSGSVLYQWTGECAVSIPLTGADWSRIYSAVVGAVGTAITGGIAAGAAGAAAGGATAALAGAQAADAAGNVGMAYSLINDTSKGVKGVVAMRESMQQAANMAIEAGKQAAEAPTKVGRAVKATRIANTVNNVIGQVMSGKHTISHSGSISGSAGMLGVQEAYLIIEYPNQSLADNYKHFVGYPSNIYAKLGTLSGYTECEQLIATGIAGLTDGEVADLIESLKGGVYLNFGSVTSKGTGITLYNYSCAPNTVGKAATVVDTLTGTFRDPVSISSPTFTIERGSPVGFNYVYIQAFDRFYYVSGVSADSKGLITVSCAIDPLETAANAIKNMDAIIKRQENRYNLYLDDGIFKAYQNPKHKLIKFPNGFKNFSYILALAGNSGS